MGGGEGTNKNKKVNFNSVREYFAVSDDFKFH